MTFQLRGKETWHCQEMNLVVQPQNTELLGVEKKILLLQGVMKWWREAVKRQRVAQHGKQRCEMRTGN